MPTQHEAHQECSCTAHVWVVPAILQWCADVVGVAQMATTVSKTHHSARSDKKVRKLLFQICTGNSTALYPIIVGLFLSQWFRTKVFEFDQRLIDPLDTGWNLGGHTQAIIR